MKRKFGVLGLIILATVCLVLYRMKDKPLGGSAALSYHFEDVQTYGFKAKKLFGASWFLLVDAFHKDGFEEVRMEAKDEDNDGRVELLSIKNIYKPTSFQGDVLTFYAGSASVQAFCGKRNEEEKGVVGYDATQKRVVCKPIADRKLTELFKLANDMMLFYRKGGEKYLKEEAAKDLQSSLKQTLAHPVKEYAKEWSLEMQESKIPEALQVLPEIPAWMLRFQ